jgi:hypothetical protein
LIAVIRALIPLETNKTFHGFINLSNVCIRPRKYPPNISLEGFINAILDGFEVSLCDPEAHLYLNSITELSRKDAADGFWNNLVNNHSILETPELRDCEVPKDSLSIKYDIWMTGVLIMQVTLFSLF